MSKDSSVSSFDGGLSYRHRIVSPTAPLAYLVHGRAGNLDVMWTFTRCLSEGWNLIAPQAPHSDSIGGFSWWNIETSDPRGEIEDAIEVFRKFDEQCRAAHQLRPPTVIAFGFSQGGALLAGCLQILPSFTDGLAMLASFVPRLREHLPQRSRLPRIFIAHGEQDDRVPLEKALAGKAFLEELGCQCFFTSEPVGHKVGSRAMRELSAWSQEFLPGQKKPS